MAYIEFQEVREMFTIYIYRAVAKTVEIFLLQVLVGPI